MNLDTENDYIFSTSVDYSVDPGEFIVELFSPNDEGESNEPKKIIRNFDELISFFEQLDEDKHSDNKTRLVKKDEIL